MFNKKDYMSSLNKARRKRNQNPYVTYLFYGLAGIAAVMVLVAVVVFARKQATAFSEWRTERAQQQAEADAAAQALEELESQKESERLQRLKLPRQIWLKSRQWWMLMAISASSMCRAT